MPQPATTASKPSQTIRVRSIVAWARWNRLMATALAKKQTTHRKHYEAPIVINRQASIDSEHYVP